MNKLPLFLSACAAALPFAETRAAVTEVFTFNGLNLAIPDGNPSGLANVQSIDSTITQIESVTVTLDISGPFNGDLYVYLAHGSGIAVLLNRVGSSSGNAFGYDDDGFSVTFDDNAAGDIHTYRNSSTPPLGAPLTGIWQPDGRSADPGAVTDTSPRSSMLGSFIGADAGGDWTLFSADLSSGDIHVLQNYSITITGTPIPEPAVPILLAAGCLALTCRRR